MGKQKRQWSGEGTHNVLQIKATMASRVMSGSGNG
jgi:hypothetical protein